MHRFTIRYIGLMLVVLTAGFWSGGCECRATSDEKPRVQEERRIRVKAPFTDVEVRVPKKDHDEHHRD